MIRIRLLEPAEFDRVREFYGTMRYHGGARESDLVLAAEEGPEIIAAVRLCEEGGELVLRGMYIREDRQRNGLGTGMLRRLETYIGTRICWCVPFRHLTRFYGQVGFEVTDPDEGPLFLRKRIDGYREEGMDVILMVRPGKA